MKFAINKLSIFLKMI